MYNIINADSCIMWYLSPCEMENICVFCLARLYVKCVINIAILKVLSDKMKYTLIE